jgi:hypothetical protein
MARFYATFDQTQVSALTEPNEYFEPCTVLQSSASAALLRDGLISSRSALSANLYTDAFGIEAVNRSGAQGTIIPADVITTTVGTSPSVSMSFSAVYTASTSAGGLVGIRIPSDYRNRPTASILSTFDANLLGRPLPIDSGSNRDYNLFLSASNAVSTVLTSIKTGSNVNRGPYERLGNTPSRTLHSIWHDTNVQYFAWDDFTPGTPSSTSGSLINPGSTNFALQLDQLSPGGNKYDLFRCSVSQSVAIRTLFSVEYFADKAGALYVSAYVREGSTSGTIYATLSNYQTTVASATGKTLIPFDWQFKMSADQGVLQTNGQGTTNIDLDAGVYYLTDVTLYFTDQNITTNQGGTSVSFTRSTPIFELTRTA